MAADFEKAKKTAAEILKRYNLTKPPVDPEEVAEREGIKVYYAKLPESLRRKVSGYFDPTKETGIGEGKGAIIINIDISASRKIFTIAHELGHVLLHRDVRESKQITSVQYRTNNWEKGNKPEQEKEADMFAANLLMPNKWVAKYYFMLEEVGKEPSPENLSKLFGVSSDAMEYRLKDMHFE